MEAKHGSRPHAAGRNITPLLYFQKPEIGSSNAGGDPRLYNPVQLIFPRGGFGIGTSIAKANAVERAGDLHLPAVVSSGPFDQDIDRTEKLSLKVGFLTVAFVNLIITFCLFFDATSADMSKVEDNPTDIYPPPVFSKVPPERSNQENAKFAFWFMCFLVGVAGMLLESALLISGYCLATLLNFLLGTAALPYFVYGFRYLLDLPMFYLALVMRSRLMCTFLAAHIHSNNRNNTPQ